MTAEIETKNEDLEQLVKLGNYLLSKKRRDLFKKHPVFGSKYLKERLSQVHDADLRNLEISK